MEIIAWGNFHVFRNMTFARKFYLREYKTHRTLLGGGGKYHENYPHVKVLTNISQNFPSAKITTFTVLYYPIESVYTPAIKSGE